MPCHAKASEAVQLSWTLAGAGVRHAPYHNHTQCAKPNCTPQPTRIHTNRDQRTNAGDRLYWLYWWLEVNIHRQSSRQATVWMPMYSAPSSQFGGKRPTPISMTSLLAALLKFAESFWYGSICLELHHLAWACQPCSYLQEYSSTLAWTKIPPVGATGYTPQSIPGPLWGSFRAIHAINAITDTDRTLLAVRGLHVLPFCRSLSKKGGWPRILQVCTTRIAPVFLGFDVILTLFYHAASTWTSPQCNAMILIHKLAFP